MRALSLPVLLFVIFFGLVACEQPKTVTAPEPVKTAAVVEIPKYSAQVFFETTSYGLTNAAGYAFSPDGKAVLMSSDASGVFNVYSLPLDGNAPEQLTSSTDNAVFAVSWFPKDLRILYTYDGGGNELNHVFVRETDGSSVDLTPGDPLKAGFLAWAKDGKSFYLVSTERDQQNFDVYR
jgi:Tol biopolymer transport system component